MKRKNYPIHPDFKKWKNINPPINRLMLPFMQKLLFFRLSGERSTKNIIVTKEIINEAKVKALLYTPKGIKENSPLLIYYHGGGFVLPAAPHHFTLLREYALKTPCKVLFVNYRLAPKYPFPIPPNDAYDAYNWAINNAQKLSIDVNKITVAGDSAGGQLAMVVCLMANEKKQIKPCSQMLIYPVTGKNEETLSMKEFVDTPLCNTKDIQKYAKLYIQNEDSQKNIYTSPIDTKAYDSFPITYIETAEFDCLRDGGILYANRLKEHQIEVTLNNTLGTIHGFDIELKSSIVKDSINQRIKFLQDVFTK